MASIFIDANIYLGFYVEKNVSLRELLKTLQNLSGEIFVTEQIVNEVDRQKLSVFLAFAKRLDTKFDLNIGLPSLSHDASREKQWRDELKRTNARIKKLQENFQNTIKETSRKISDSSDVVSVSLTKLFENSVSPSAEEITRARYRKEMGAPPGKRTDPIGDQISWEQFLSQLQSDQSVWIVTRDRDFTDEIYGDPRLKPPLQKEIRKRIGDTAGIHCFIDLLQALEHYKKHSGKRVSNFPSKATIKKIEEEAARVSQSVILHPPPPSPSYPSFVSTYSPSSTFSGVTDWHYHLPSPAFTIASPGNEPFSATEFGTAGMTCSKCGSSSVSRVLVANLDGTHTPGFGCSNCGNSWRQGIVLP